METVREYMRGRFTWANYKAQYAFAFRWTVAHMPPVRWALDVLLLPIGPIWGDLAAMRAAAFEE